MEIKYIDINLIKPYKKIRNYDKSMYLLISSIKQFGFISPILIDKNYNVICGNARLEGSKKCNYTKIPCIIINSLTEDEIKAYRIIDNQIGEFSLWDYKLKKEEINTIETSLFDYGLPEDYLTDINIDDFFEESSYEQISIFDEELL